MRSRIDGEAHVLGAVRDTELRLDPVLVRVDGLRADAELLADLLRPGGMLVLDDFTPGRDPESDPTRRLWLESNRFRTVELTLSADTAVLLAVRAA